MVGEIEVLEPDGCLSLFLIFVFGFVFLNGCLGFFILFLIFIFCFAFLDGCKIETFVIDYGMLDLKNQKYI